MRLFSELLEIVKLFVYRRKHYLSFHFDNKK